VRTAKTSLLLPRAALISDNLVLSLPINTTLHPSESSLFAVTLPTPPVAPVIIATFPFSFIADKPIFFLKYFSYFVFANLQLDCK
jgi:hypothetical protein